MSDRPHVLIVVENLPVPFDRRVWLEATTLRANGYEVSVICPTGKGHDARYEVLDGIHVYRHRLPEESGAKLDYLREYLAALIWELRLARRAARRRPIDVIHICNPPDLLFLVAGWHKLLSGARVVFDHHDVNPELYVEKYRRRDLFYHGLRLAERATFAVADVVISTNESYRRVALERGRKDPENVFVVRSAPDLRSFTPRPADPELRRGRRFLVGYVGVMAEQDGVDNLLHAAHHLVRELGRDEIQFLLVGGGPSSESLKRLAADLGIEDHVTFAGFQSGDTLLRMLSSCDVCISPDPATEYNHLCTMNKILEYMALGKPIVQFDLREGRASAAEASLYASDSADMGAKVGQLLDDPELRRELGQIGRKRLEDELEWRHQVPKLLRAYQRVLAARGGA